MDSESKENARPDVSIIEYNGFKIVCRMIMSIPFQKFGVETYSRDTVLKRDSLSDYTCSDSLCIKPTSPAAFQFEKPPLLLRDIRLIHHNQHHRRLGWLPMIYLSCKLRVMEIANFEQ
ncbi:uncharacterized protein LOC112191468 isoform X2 [Rosa chinensis]|nr:uncharacterized protein LOC112191468 isoform X2 [Rosa chinensis]